MAGLLKCIRVFYIIIIEYIISRLRPSTEMAT